MHPNPTLYIAALACCLGILIARAAYLRRWISYEASLLIAGVMTFGVVVMMLALGANLIAWR